MAVSFLTGQRLTADLLNNNIIGYLPVTYTKLALTARTSTVTVTDDVELTGIPLSVGTWEVDMQLGYTTPTGGTQGFRTLWGFTGTWSGTTIRYCIGPGNASASAPDNSATAAVLGRTLDTQEITYLSNTSGIYSQVRELSRAVVVTVAGNLSLKWAQSVSVASATNLQQTSTITVRKISA